MKDKFNYYSPKRDFVISSINTAFIRDTRENFYFAGEMHDFWEMVYCMDGNITVPEDDRTYELSGGQVIFHKPMEFHRLKASKGQRAQLLIISFSCEKDSLIEELKNGVFTLDIHLRQNLMQAYKKIKEAFNCETWILDKGAEDPLEENSALLTMELLLLNILSSVRPDKAGIKSISAQNYKRILNVMKNHIDENLSVDELAALCFLGTSNMKKTFKQYAGCGVKEHYNKLRMIRACELLGQEMSVSEVSRLLNFSSTNYFTNVFKKEMGTTPTGYKASKMM